MKEKYYTPTIEEFHVGFECELKNSSDPKNFEWENLRIITVDDAVMGEGYLMDWSFYDSRNAISDESIRIKYLDHQDVESLGWEEGTYKTINGYIKDNKILTINYNYKKGPVVDISLLPFLKDQGLSRIFRGTIKNKSELIKLMKQLRING